MSPPPTSTTTRIWTVQVQGQKAWAVPQSQARGKSVSSRCDLALDNVVTRLPVSLLRRTFNLIFRQKLGL